MTSSYNRDSNTQHEDFVRSLDTLLECIDAAEVERTQLYSLIDYGCSLGANSILAMNRLIQYIHEHKSVDAFSAYHNDLPSNDFNALLNTLGRSSHNYQNISGCRAFTQLVPASFFQQVVPDRQIDLFIRFCLQNNGRLSGRKRVSHFDFLSEDEIASLEQAVQSAYESETFNNG